MLVLIINDGSRRASFAHKILNLRASKNGIPFFLVAEIRMGESKDYAGGMLVDIMRAYTCGISHRGYKGVLVGHGHPEVRFGQLNSEVNYFLLVIYIVGGGARWDFRAPRLVF